jgi:crossover junction endodeoxyribonuclease RuvC
VTRGGVSRIFGIDPGLASTGFAVVDRLGHRLQPVWYDCLTTASALPDCERLVAITAAVRQVIGQFTPDCAAIETLFFGASAPAAFAVGQARGACIVACAEAGLEIFEYPPATIKQAVTGYGRADKQQVGLMVQRILGMSEVPKPDHAADAFAAAICHGGAATILR